MVIAAAPALAPDSAVPVAEHRTLMRACACAPGKGREEERQLRRSGTGLRPSRIPASGLVPAEVVSSIDTSRGGGRPLPPATRDRLEPVLGENLAEVRVHADTRAGTLARAVAAEAFTVGSDVFFASGAYRPGSPDGDRLIAHEATHAVQQRGAPASGSLSVSAPGDLAEVQAESVANRSGQARTGQIARGAARTVARKPDPDAGAPPAGSATPAVAATLPAIAPPAKIEFPSVKGTQPGPGAKPAMTADCASLTGFFNDPPTRNRGTTGTKLSPAEVAKRRADIAQALTAAQADRPLSAANLQHWLDATGTPIVMASAVFKTGDSDVPFFLANEASQKFATGFKNRLKDPKHPQGTMRPASLTKGAKGPARFLQYENGVRPSMTATPKSTDLATALGAFNVHSAIWAEATYVGKEGGILGIGADDVFTVQVLRWCVQIYDVYDWNGGAKTPFPVPTAKVGSLPLPKEAVTVTNLGAGFSMVTVKDDYFRDLEVSGGGRAYLIRSETFEAPSSTPRTFTIKI